MPIQRRIRRRSAPGHDSPRRATASPRCHAPSYLPARRPRPGSACAPASGPATTPAAPPARGPADHGGRTDHKQSSDIPLPHFRGLPQLLFSTGGMLSRHQAEPGGEVATAPELLHRRGEGFDRERGDRADPACLQLARHLRFVRHGRNPGFQGVDPVGQMGGLLEEHAADVPGKFRHVGVGIIDDLREARQVADALGGDMAELVEMRPQRVHGLGALLDKLLARPERHGPCLLVGGFRFHEPHGRRNAASTIASASAASFFCRLMNGLT